MSPAFTITNFGGGAGVSGVGDTGILGSGEGTGVYGESASINGIGVDGHGAGQGVKGTAAGANSIGVSGIGHTGVVGTGEGGGVLGGPGVYGVSPEAGVRGFGDAYGVRGDSDSGGFSAGVYGTDSSSGVGVFGETSNSTAYALYGKSHGLGYAGYFDGNVHVQGTFSKSGGSFKIDHPLDPTGKYLSHSFVESPDMMNIYNGIAGLDATGTARVALPEWFDALNRDFRYQLTAMGTPQPGLYVADEIHENSFRIAGGAPGARVSWQVTGIRHDVWADAHRIPVEEAKPGEEQGTYLEPELFGEPAEKSVRSSKERRRGE
jgi:hypothetical protein